MLKIEYIYNSSWHIETDHYQFLIDYYRGEVNLVPDKPCVFIVTHDHEDHFNPVIFEMDRGEDIYLLSWDTEIQHQERRYILQPHEHFSIGDISIKTCGSTDAGISIFFEVDSHRILHAGDLNLWIWPEDTEEERINMKASFEEEVNCFKDKTVDVAFFPVDSRLQERALGGVPYFVDTLKPKHFIPMHFREDRNALEDLQQKYGNHPSMKLLIPTRENDQFELLTHY